MSTSPFYEWIQVSPILDGFNKLILIKLSKSFNVLNFPINSDPNFYSTIMIFMLAQENLLLKKGLRLAAAFSVTKFNYEIGHTLLSCLSLT